jgi:hypothetical protein
VTLVTGQTRIHGHIVLQRYAFGRDEYRYFRFPLPNIARELRTARIPASGVNRQPRMSIFAVLSSVFIGSLPAATGRKTRFTGTTVLRLKDGKIVEEIGLDDGVTALQPSTQRDRRRGASDIFQQRRAHLTLQRAGHTPARFMGMAPAEPGNTRTDP